MSETDIHQPDSILSIKEIEIVWDKLSETFRNSRGIRPRKTWFTTGLSERVGQKRVRILEGSQEAKAFFSLTQNCSNDQLIYLFQRAKVNLEQAQLASKVSVSINVTWVIGFYIIFNQVFPGHIAESLRSLSTDDPSSYSVMWAFGIIGIFVLAPFIVAVSYGGVAMAQDLKNLCELSLARRKIPVDNVSEVQDHIEEITKPLKQIL